MTTDLSDTNILLDIATETTVWSDWSLERRGIAAGRGPVLINDIVYSEFSAGFLTIEETGTIMVEFSIIHVQITLLALLMAAKAYKRYRAAGGTRASMLPDFLSAPMP